MNNITFVLFSFNEEKRISYAIKNFIKYGEVIVLDGGSTDNTQKVSEELGARFIQRVKTTKPQVENSENFNQIYSIINTDWIYWGYVDNIAPKKLVEKLVGIVNENKYKRVIAPMKTYLWGNTKECVQKSHIPIAFHKDYMNFDDNKIHNMGKFTGSSNEELILPFNNDYTIRHFSLYSETKFINGYLRYAEEEARSKFESGERFSLIKMIAAMLRYAWIYRRSLMQGKIGVITILNFSFSRVMTYARLYEIENNITLESIESEFGKEKEKIIQDFE